MPEQAMSCARQRSNRSCRRYRWASACGHSVAWGWDAAAWEWDAAWEAAAVRRACRTGAGCTDVVDRKKNPRQGGALAGIETGGSKRWVEPSVEWNVPRQPTKA